LDKEKAFGKKVKELVKKAENLEDAGVKKVIKQLAEARKEIAATVASTEWEAYHLPQMKAAVERAMQRFGLQYGVDLKDAQRDFWDRGIDMVDLPLREVGIFQALPEIDTTALAVMQGFSADLVKGLTLDATQKINTELTLGIMGQKTPFEVMKGIGRNLKDPSIFKSIAARAEAITRTESTRVLESAGQARKESAAKVVPGLQKQWLESFAARMPRPTHVAAHKQIRDVNKPFDVGGVKMMYPGDTSLGAGAKDTVKCG
jgi:hypothetical protein